MDTKLKPTPFRIALGAAVVLVAVGATTYLTDRFIVAADGAGSPLAFGYHRSISFTDVANSRAMLMDGFESYWSISDVENFLRQRSLAGKIELGPRPGPRDRRPPFIVDTVTVKEYSHLGSKGELVIKLFNNRLVGTRFFPEEIDTYLERLAKMNNINLSERSSITIEPYTRVWIAEDVRQKRRYVGWGIFVLMKRSVFGSDDTREPKDRIDAIG